MGRRDILDLWIFGMTLPISCNLVLPDIRFKFKDFHDLTEPDEKVWKPQPKPDFVLTPSAGESTQEIRPNLGVQIKEQRGSAVKRAANIFLSDWKSANPKSSFRNLVQAIIRANRWKIPLIVKEESTEELNKNFYDERGGINFNVNAFTSVGSGNAGLSKKARSILTKNPWERTEDEMEILYTVVNQMKCFAKYSSLVRHELATVINLETFDDGRVIIQEGYQGISMYFIVTGSVLVQVSHIDVRTGDKKHYVVGEINAGSSFGEVALIQECKRTATIVCKGTSQFLRVDKQDFDWVLRRSYEQEWQDRLNMVKSIPFFSDWSEGDLRHITLNCFVQEYQPENVVLGDCSDVTESIYYVVSGICEVVRQINILETTSHIGGQTMLSLPPSKENMRCDNKIRTRFLNIVQLFPGDFFGVGENLKNYYILTLCRVQCLLVPRHAVAALERVSNHTGQDIYKRFTIAEMLAEAQARLLSEEVIFEKWMAHLRWKNFKKKTVKEVLSRKPSIIRNHPRKPFRFKEFQLQNELPTENYHLSVKLSQPYHVFRRAGFQNINHHKLPPIEKKKKTNPEKHIVKAKESEKLPRIPSMPKRSVASDLSNRIDLTTSSAPVLRKKINSKMFRNTNAVSSFNLPRSLVIKEERIRKKNITRKKMPKDN